MEDKMNDSKGLLNEYPIVSELRLKQQRCAQKLNDFKAFYQAKMYEVHHLLNEKEYDILGGNLTELNNMIRQKHADIKLCYDDLKKHHHKYIKRNDSFEKSHINIVQKEIGKKFKEYQIKIKSLDDMNKNMGVSLNKHKTLAMTLESMTNLDQNYFLFYSWFIITLILCIGMFLYLSNTQTPLNGVILAIAFFVSIYFILQNISMV